MVFSQALQGAFSLPHKVDARQDSSSSMVSRTSAENDGHADTPARSSSNALAFLTRGSSKPKVAQETQELSCDVAIRPSFCWNSHQEAWQSGVWSQFESGLKSCQDDAYACTNFMGRSDAAFAGVFDGHGFNGRSAATYACKNITRWLGVDPNSVAKDPRRRLKALESVCGQIQRGLARQELCGFDASSSGLATCCALLQGDRLCVATIGPCKAVVGRPDSNSPSRLKAVELSQPESAARAPSESTLRRLSPSMMFAKTSMPLVPSSSSRGHQTSGQGFLGRGPSGEPSSVQPVMTLHQLSSQDHFVVVATSGVWEVMTAQEVVDFVHQSRQCRPDSLSCSAALTIEAQTRWKLKFAKVIAEDVASVVLHYGTPPKLGKPSRDLPAFPQAATSNHEANGDSLLHETREFWARLQPESLVPLLQTEGSKGKGVVPTQFFPTRVSPPLSIPIKRSSSSLHIPQPRHSPPSKSFAQPHASSSQCETQEGSQHSREGSQHSTEGSQHSTDNSQHSHTGRRQSRDSVRSSGSRTVRFDLPSSPEGSGHLRQDLLPGEQLKKGQQSERRAHGQHHKSSPVAIAFRPDTPDTLHDVAGHLSSSSSHSSIDIIPDDSPSPSNAPTLKADSPPSAQQGLHKPQHRSRHRKPPPRTSSAFRQAEQQQQQQQQQQSAQRVFVNPFAAAAVQLHSSSSDSDLSLEKEAAESSVPAATSVLRSPKATRTHVQHALEDGDVQEVVAEAAAPMTAQMRLSMDRAHSAGHWAASRHVIGPIPEDRPLGSSPPNRGMHAENRPIRKIYPHGSGDLDALLASLPPTAPPASSSPVRTRTDFHQFDLSSFSGMISGMNPFPPPHPVLSESAPRRLTTQLSLPRAHIEEHDLNEHEGRVRGGFPRVSSNTELNAGAESIPVQATPFAGYEASYSSSLHHDQEPSLASHQSSGGINPWAASEQSSMLDSNSRSSRSILGSVHGSRSRNSSAVLDELVRQRSCGEYYLPSATSTSM